VVDDRPAGDLTIKDRGDFGAVGIIRFDPAESGGDLDWVIL
jgi:hypothetical protein